MLPCRRIRVGGDAPACRAAESIRPSTEPKADRVMSVELSHPASRLRLAAWLILVAGLVAAVLVYLRAADTAPDDGAYRIVDGQAYAANDSAGADLQSERLGGKALVRTAAFDRWLGSLWHGRRLAWTVLAITAALAGLCFHIAGLIDEPVD
jgi:hypothetical protein